MRRRLRELGQRRTEAGYAALLVAIMFPVVFLGCAAVAVDTSRWYLEIQEIQKAADAAALAGVPYLPQDMPSAAARAKTVAARNGFDDASPDVIVSASQGSLPSQLKVSITATIPNTFGTLIGTGRTTITRSGTADYQGAAPMGSPCNVFGNEPPSGTGGAQPVGDAMGAGKFPNCSTNPQFWATVEGPETGKVQGDRYQTKGCEDSGVDGCTGKNNDEYDPFGYVFIVKVQPAAVNKTIDLQLFDPEFTDTGQLCDLLPKSSSFPSNNNKLNPYVTNNDARSRYSSNGTDTETYCTGDNYPGAGSGTRGDKHALTTSFVLRQQTDTQDPQQAAVQNDTSGNACIKQYGTYNNAENSISANVFDSTKGAYNAQVAQSFHNWVDFCKFTPTRSGNYFLQVRTNVSLGGSGSGILYSGNSAAAAATGNTTSGEGSNSFAMRAVMPAGFEQQVSVSGYNHMPIFANSDAAQSTFNLIQVLPGAAGQYISFSFFDAGDATNSGSVRVIVPGDATGSITSTPFPGNCQANGAGAGSGQTLSNCKATISNAKNNGKTETITIPVPTDYTCNYASLSGCWYQVEISFPSGSVHDVTTWNATIVGDPVRLIH